MIRIRRWVFRFWALWLPIVGLGELSLQRWAQNRAPRFEDYAVLGAHVSALHQPGDVVVVAPRWAEPMVRRALGDELMPLSQVARPDVTGYFTALEIRIVGQRSEELEGWPELGREQHGAFELVRRQNPRAEPATLDFVDALGPDTVHVSWPGGGACTWRADAPVSAGGLGGHPTFGASRFVCANSELFNVGVTVIADEEFSPRRCIWAHPPAHGELSIVYRDVQLGTRIVGHGGMYWMVERERMGVPVVLTVRALGRELGQVAHQDGDGWARFEVPLSGLEGQRGDVELAVSSANNAHRHYCFEARMQ